jgi:hypothetical protein
MTRYEKRLRTLARDLGLCPVHIERPVCVRCEMTWAGTDAERDALDDFIARSCGGTPLAPAVLRCQSCGDEWAVCLSCLEVDMAHRPLPAKDPLSPDERARYDALIPHVRPKPRRGVRHEAL